MSSWLDHLILLPILLPLLFGGVLVLLNERHHQLKFMLNLLATLLLLALALFLLYLTDLSDVWAEGIGVYLAANWAAPFGIALVADRLSSMMLLLTAVIATAALVFSYTRWSQVGVHFHTLFQWLLMGINGAFLTGDLFNLFVFFEVMLAASYGLLLHGYNKTRVRAGMQYITINLVSSFFLLLGIALVYAATGTLNMADIALRAASLKDTDSLLLQTGAGILAVAFLTKSAMWPLGFWLPMTYSAAIPPVAAMLVLMTKIGFYALLRLWLLVFSAEAGDLAGWGSDLLLVGGLLTLTFGTIGLLGSQEPGRVASYSAIISSGTLLTLLGYHQPQTLGAALFYLISSTLAVSCFVLLIELMERIRTPTTNFLALTMEALAIQSTEEETAGIAVPAAMAFLGLVFMGSALIIAGLPPLSGFIAKFSIFHGLLHPTSGEIGWIGWLFMALVILSGMAAIIALMRFGVRTFWSITAPIPPRITLTEGLPVLALLLLAVSMTFAAGPVRGYLDRVAADQNNPQRYIQQVLTTPVAGTSLQEIK